MNENPPAISHSQALNSYLVSIRTSDQRDADFDGQAFITIHGWNGSTPELPLVDSGRTTAAFTRAQVSSFTVNSVDVGYLSSITIRMVPSATDPDWCVDTIDIENTGYGSSATFTYGSRLNTDNTSVSIYKTVPLTDFMVEVYTSDNGDAGFDGEVTIQLDGMYGSSDVIPLVSDDDAAAYSPSSIRQFRIKASDVGTITCIGVALVGPNPP